MGVRHVGVELDDGGIVLTHLRSVLEDLASDGITPKYLYTIPTVQNPTGTVMPLDRRQALLALAREYSLPIFEDECYADLTWGCERPPSLRALDADGGQVIYCGSFSKSIAPALRVGYLVADEPVIQQLLALSSPQADIVTVAHDGFVEPLLALYGFRCLTAIKASLLTGEAKMTSWWGHVRVQRVEESLLRE